MVESNGESFAVIIGDRKDSGVHPDTKFDMVISPLREEKRNRKIESRK